MALPTRITAIEISAERDRRTYHSRIVEPEASTPQAKARGNLYILLNLSGTGTGQARLSRQILNTIQAIYYEQMAGPITHSLTQAILSAHSLVRQSSGAASQTVWRGSVACLVVRGRDLFICHAGPAMSFVAHPDTVDMFPAEIPEATTFLGDKTAPDIEFFQTKLRGDARVILTEAHWLDHIPIRAMAAMAATPDMEASIGYLRDIAEKTQLASLVIDIETKPEAWSHIPGLEEKPGGTEDLATAEQAPSIGEGPAPSYPAVEKPSRLTAPRRRPPVSVPRSVTMPSGRPRSLQPSASAPASHATERQTASIEQARPVGPAKVAEESPRPEQSSSAAPEAKRRRSLWRRESAKRGVARPQKRSRWAVAAALVIPLVTALLVGAVYWQRGMARTRQFNELLD
ncbi:MAG: hypothetical protein J7M34_01000, partial [Anaerolineae bacterium]|nr:hypothetical protein [Anaerolineae bacterium]